jgi:hypothetical protein
MQTNSVLSIWTKDGRSLRANPNRHLDLITSDLEDLGWLAAADGPAFSIFHLSAS